MALGKAFIEVHADTAPFARQLGRDLNAIIKAAEKDVRTSSRKLGETVSDEAGKGIRANRSKITRGVGNAVDAVAQSGVFSRLSKGIVDTIDDGLSGLPAEIKVILGATLAAAAPIAFALGAGLAGAITAGLLTFGTAAFGVLIAAQFQEVQDAAASTFAFIREQFLQGSRFFIRPFLNALALIRERFVDLQPALISLMSRAAQIIVPLTDALIGFFEQALPGLTGAFDNIGPILTSLQIGLRLIGESVGTFFQTIANNDDTGRVIYDLSLAIANLIDLLALLINHGLNLYGVLLDIASLLDLGLFEDTDEQIEILGKHFGIASQESGNFGDAVEGTITPLEAQEKAIKDMNKQLETYIDLQFDIVGNRISWEQAIDDLTESVKENGRSLKETEQEGRNNALALLELAKVAINTRADNIALGDSAIEAQVKFEAQRAKIYELGRQLKLSKTDMDKLVGAILSAPPPVDTGISQDSVDRLAAAARWAQTLATRIARLIAQGAASVATRAAGPQPHAHGGVFSTPHVGLVAEAGPEAIIPLSNPSRAAEVLNESGLSSMLSPTVNVYIGNEQIQAYIAVETNRQLAISARSMSYGTRGI